MHFIEYQTREGTKGCILWEYEFRIIKLITSRDVTFNERQFPYKKRHEISSTSQAQEEPLRENDTLEIGDHVEPNKAYYDRGWWAYWSRHIWSGTSYPSGWGLGELIVDGQDDTAPNPQELEPSAGEIIVDY